MQTMYPGIPNSPSTTLSNDITNSQTTITVADITKIPPAPNELTIGIGEDAETITYTGISGSNITGVTRGFEGVAKAWSSGTSIGRNFTNYDYSTFISNINAVSNTNFLKQAIINGNFQVNQRVVSGTVTLSAGQYGHDRWKAGNGGCIYTFTTSGNVTTITIVSGTLVQVIEGNNLFTNTYTLSWTGTAQGRINGGTYGNNEIIASITGGSNTTIEFGIGTLSKVQFNIGNIALPFSLRSFAEELTLCLRYYFKTYNYTVVPGSLTDVGSKISFARNAWSLDRTNFEFITGMRIAPTVVIYSTATGTIGKAYDGLAAVDKDCVSFNITQLGFEFSGANHIIPDNYYRFHFVADAEL